MPGSTVASAIVSLRPSETPIVMLSVRVTVFGQASVTVTSNACVSTVSGAPVIWPVAALNVSWLGSVPAVIAKEYGGTPAAPTIAL